MIVFLLFFIGIAGNLLPTWMFLNSMQLLVHIPLLSGTSMPANLHVFFKLFLDILRPNLVSIDEDIDSSNSSLIRDCGYSASFLQNAKLILIIGATLVGIIALFSLVRLLKYFSCCPMKSTKILKKIYWMSNFSLRFLYQVFFELYLCLMIYVTSNTHSDTDRNR